MPKATAISPKSTKQELFDAYQKLTKELEHSDISSEEATKPAKESAVSSPLDGSISPDSIITNPF